MKEKTTQNNLLKSWLEGRKCIHFLSHFQACWVDFVSLPGSHCDHLGLGWSASLHSEFSSTEGSKTRPSCIPYFPPVHYSLFAQNSFLLWPSPSLLSSGCWPCAVYLGWTSVCPFPLFRKIGLTHLKLIQMFFSNLLVFWYL